MNTANIAEKTFSDLLKILSIVIGKEWENKFNALLDVYRNKKEGESKGSGEGEEKYQRFLNADEFTASGITTDGGVITSIRNRHCACRMPHYTLTFSFIDNSIEIKPME